MNGYQTGFSLAGSNKVEAHSRKEGLNVMARATAKLSECSH